MSFDLPHNIASGQPRDAEPIQNNFNAIANVLDGGITDEHIAADSIGTSELKTDAVYTENIKDLNVTTNKIADLNVTTAKIADLNVTSGKIAANNITVDKLQTGLVQESILGTQTSVNNGSEAHVGTSWELTFAPATDCYAYVTAVVGFVGSTIGGSSTNVTTRIKKNVGGTRSTYISMIKELTAGKDDISTVTSLVPLVGGETTKIELWLLIDDEPIDVNGQSRISAILLPR